MPGGVGVGAVLIADAIVVRGRAARPRTRRPTRMVSNSAACAAAQAAESHRT
ncbi:hypothetical protein [Pseudonocardia sp. ICBG1142]|uniref:hypothetical protein n=1 Tax=Pseudonocardia sp. ICBG1142 TaxID=2846760 RepID=UPI001CF6A542|nr:hypothetical protein [Pseudonocardia sp. ICBG1142]